MYLVLVPMGRIIRSMWTKSTKDEGLATPATKPSCSTALVYKTDGNVKAVDEDDT